MDGSMMCRKPSTSKKSLCAPGQSREALKDTSAPVLNTPRFSSSVVAPGPGGGAVVSEPPAHARRHVEPAEKGLRQQQLVVRVRPGSRVIQARRRAELVSAKSRR